MTGAAPSTDPLQNPFCTDPKSGEFPVVDVHDAITIEVTEKNVRTDRGVVEQRDVPRTDDTIVIEITRQDVEPTSVCGQLVVTHFDGNVVRTRDHLFQDDCPGLSRA